MNFENRFIKLMTICVDGQERLLYGFSVSTAQTPRPWRQKRDKRKLNVSFSILSPDEAEQFEQSLMGTEDVSLGELTLSAPELFPRSPVLSYSGEWKKLAPISRLSCVRELWNTKKEGLVQQMQTGLGAQGRELYLKMREMLSQLKEECGVDFAQDGARFGNYEHYHRLALACDLEARCPKASAGKKIVIRKRAEWNRPLIVNCTAERYGRFQFNQVGVLRAEDSEIAFTSEEAVGRYTVYAWDQETHELVFFQPTVLCHQIILEISVGETTRVVRDPWSESLLASAANRSDVIHRQIEAVQRHSSEGPIRIGGSEDPISRAADSGEQLLSLYACSPCQGAFVPNVQRDGEIQSFLKISHYLEERGVCRAVIADPYFSIRTAAKVLPRIANTDLELAVVTSLGTTDPDSGEKKNVVEDYREFLKDHVGAIHKKLYVCNLHRGKKPVFHDRYLIRYFTDGRIDGFLLSNSLNSMGQFYPFVIAPMEEEVCRSVVEYLDQLQDTQAQAKLPKKQRIVSDVLFDYRRATAPPPQTPEHPADQNWLTALTKRPIREKELPGVLDMMISHWEEEKEEVCQALGLLGGRTHFWSAIELAALLWKRETVAKGYIDHFSEMAREIEQSRRHDGPEAEGRETTLWALLIGKAEPDQTGFSKLLDYSHRVYYANIYWLSGGYHLLLELDPGCFVRLLEETCSPMMFSCLAERLSIWPWSEPLYHCLVDSKNTCVRLLAVHWPGYLFELDRLGPDVIFRLLDGLEPDCRMLQAARLLSTAAFCIRYPKPVTGCWSEIFPRLLECAASALPLCTQAGRQLALNWLYDCEECSYCRLHLELARLTKDGAIQKDLFHRAVTWMEDYFTRLDSARDVSQHITLYLDGMEQLYGEQTEKELLGRFLDWDAFEAAVEPALQDYDYTRWYKAYVRAGWQLALLKDYLARRPHAQDAARWLDMWEDRIAAETSKEAERRGVC